MAVIAFDTLAYVRRVVAAGMPRDQAEAQAEAMKEAFVHNVDALVTRDYLDVRFSEFETRVEASINKRCTEMESSIDKRFTSMDKRFTAMESSIDKRFTEMESSIDKRFTESAQATNTRFSAIDTRFAGIDVRLERMEGRFNLVYWMQGLTIACVVIPVIRAFSA